MKLAENMFKIESPANLCILTDTICIHVEGNKYHPPTGDCRTCKVPDLMKERAVCYLDKRLRATEDKMFNLNNLTLPTTGPKVDQ